MNARRFVAESARGLFLVCFLILATGVSAFAQAGRGSVSGTISDPGGAVVAGAQVELLNKATGVALHTVANSAGLYAFISLNPGVYQVKASQSGFASVAQDKVGVNVDQSTEVNITLKVGSATESVTVTEATSLVEASNSTVGTLVGAETIDRVPLLYRNVFDLVQLSAGVTPANGSPNSSDSMQSVQNISVGRPGVDVSSATINGAIVGSVYYMLDGSPIGIAENNAAAIIPAMNIPEDGVEEVRVETQNTPASYQSGAAGVISLVSKTGTNKFHGDVFGVFRPNALSANDYFNNDYEIQNGLKNAPPSFYRYQEGAALGGPIIKDKLFFFADYEDTQQQQFEGIKTYSVPTSAERTGDFSAMGFTVYDPTQPDTPDGTRQPFAGNVITNPNPIGLLFLSNMPKCNFPSPATCDSATSDVVNNYSAPGLDPFKGHRFDVRLDWAKSERQRLFTRFSYDKLVFSTANVFPSPGWDIDYAQNTTNARNVLVADDLTLNPSTVLQLRYSFTRHFENQGGPASYLSNDITTQGFPASLAAQVVYKQIPFMQFNDIGGGVGGTADYNNFRYASENSDVNATITKVIGKQVISTGFEWMKRYLNVGQPPAPAGTYAFDVSATDQQTSPASGVPFGGSDYASLLIGMGTVPGSENGNYPNFTKDVFAAESNPYYALFIEDTYHVSKALTITAGLRWDIFAGRNERFNRQEYFDPAAAGSASGVSYTGAEIYVNSGSRSPFTTNFHNFGPRLAIAWQPADHLVVRGGFGFYYGPSTHNVASAGQNTDGFSSQTAWNATCLNGDGNTVFFNANCSAPTPGDFTGAYSLSNPFPNGVVPTLTIPPTGLANNLGNTLETVLHSQRTPTTYNFNLAVEYELPHQVVVTIGYVGSRGLFLPLGNVDLNTLNLATIAKYGYSLCVDTSQPSCQYVNNQWAPIQPPTNAFFGQSTVPLWASLQPFPQFGDGSYGGGNGVIVNGYPGGDSEYSSLQTKVQKRLTSHFTTLATFTWGKILTDDGNPPLGFVGTHAGAAQDWRDLGWEHSISPQDVKYQFSGQMSYDLPVGKGQRLNLNGVPNAALGGWTINAIGYFSTGVPIASPTSGTPIGYINQRADSTNCTGATPHTVTVWLTYSCFVAPGTENGGVAIPYIPGSAPAYLDHVRTRGARDVDLSIYKTFMFGETKALRFDISAYNISNTAQYGYPGVPSVAVVNSAILAAQTALPSCSPNCPVPPNPASFGTITNTVNTPRQLQFGARFTF